MAHLSSADHKKMLDQLARHEGTKRDKAGNHIAYRCTADALTIGYGHNLDANPLPGINASSRLTEEQALEILNNDVAVVEQQLSSRLPWALDLSPARYAVLVNLAFNIGIAGLLGFKNTLAFIREGEFANAAANMLASKWAGQVKGRATELAEQMKSGAWK